MLDFRLEQKALHDRGAACSVGFLPKEWKFADEDENRPFGIDFKRQELLEISVVPIGSNRDAMLRMKAAGIDLNPVADWAERYRQASTGIIAVDLETAEAIVAALDPSKGMKLFTLSGDEIRDSFTGPESAPEAKAPETELRPDSATAEEVDGEALDAKKDAPPIAGDPGIPVLVTAIGKLVAALTGESTARAEKDQATKEIAKEPVTEVVPDPDPEALVAASEAFALDYAREIAQKQFIARTGQPFTN
jgi:hypothetical protein